MYGIGKIFKSNEEIEELKAELREREKNRKTQKQLRAELIKHLKGKTQ